MHLGYNALVEFLYHADTDVQSCIIFLNVSIDVKMKSSKVKMKLSFFTRCCCGPQLVVQLVMWRYEGGAGNLKWLRNISVYFIVKNLSFIVIIKQTLTEDRCDMIVFAISFSSE